MLTGRAAFQVQSPCLAGGTGWQRPREVLQGQMLNPTSAMVGTCVTDGWFGWAANGTWASSKSWLGNKMLVTEWTGAGIEIRGSFQFPTWHSLHNIWTLQFCPLPLEKDIDKLESAQGRCWGWNMCPVRRCWRTPTREVAFFNWSNDGFRWPSSSPKCL